MHLGLGSGTSKLCKQGPLAQIWDSLLTAWGPTCLASGFLGGFGDRPTSESTRRVVSIWTLDKFICMCLLCEAGTVIPSWLGDGENKISFEQLPAAGRTRKLCDHEMSPHFMSLAPLAFVNTGIPLVTSTRKELEASDSSTASADCSPAPQPQVALGPHVCLVFCLQVQDGLVWDKDCFCFLLLHKQKHSPISLLRGLRRKLSQVGCGYRKIGHPPLTSGLADPVHEGRHTHQYIALMTRKTKSPQSSVALEFRMAA